MTDLRKASVEVPDDDKPDVITSFRKNRITLDSYIVPVVFEKSPQIHKEVSREREQEGGGEKYACVLSEATKPELQTALESLDHAVCYSGDGRTLPDHIPDDCDMVFVCDKFEGEAYDYLHSRKLRIVGPPCVFACDLRQVQLPNSVRPIYSAVMMGVVICFTGFKSKEELHHLCCLAHLMGASIRKDMVSNVTHIVARAVNGSKYKVAVTRGTPIMSEKWITECWEHREDTSAVCTQPPFSEHKQLPFTGCVLALYGFLGEEEKEMKEIAVLNGAITGTMGEAGLTHLVVSDDVDPAHIPTTPFRIHIVKQQWFWESIQIEASADEQLYQVKEGSSYNPHSRRRRGRQSNTSFMHTSVSSMDVSCLLEASLFSLSSPIASKGLSKTKKSPGSMSPLVGTCSNGAASSYSQRTEDTARRHIASELLQTEKNFVEILDVIVKVFKDPLERPDQRGGPLLSHEDIKSIFGNIPEILSVHRHLVAGLEEQLKMWSDETCIGKVVLKQSDALLRVYPPFVNFFDLSKEALQKCDKTFPRFHAFLKSNESRPECGRQTLAELLITPVQRIPRIILLLKDLVKRTSPSHPDFTALQKAEESLKTVMNHINEDRRKTEGQMHMFEVLRDVEGCPANILSSHRSFLRRVDVLDIGNPGKGTKGDSLTIFIFSDSLEVAKRRSGFGLRNSATKLFKHLEFIPLTSIKSIIQFGDTGDYSSSFGILLHCLDDVVEKLLVFRLQSGEGSAAGVDSKEEVVQLLAKLLADSIFSSNPEEFIVSSPPDVLNSMCKTSVSSTTLKRALHGARKKVRRAFSGSKQGRKQSLSSSSLHLNLNGIGEENEVPQDVPESPNNTSISSNISALTFATPVASLRTPRPKRPALSRLPSYSTADLTNLGTEL